MNDLRFALRQLLKTSGFTAVAVLTLALGIGANTAIFSVMDRLLVRPLPVANPQQLALVAHADGGTRPEFDFTYRTYRDYQRDSSVFSQLAVTMDESVGLGTAGATERQQALLVSGNYFALLGVDAALGRTFAPGEGVEIDDAPVVVLSHGLWQRGFGADPQVIGRKVTVNSRSFTVIGVAPREFAGTTRGLVPDLYVPITMFGQLTAERPGGENPLSSRYYARPWVLGRLKDGVSRTAAEAALGRLARQANAAGIPNSSTNLVLLPGAQGFSQNLQEARLPLNLLLGTSGLVLLIACVNLANLQLARATGRARDFAIRLALGASRGRIIRELLTESAVLALAGGAAGMLVAVWLTRLLGQFRLPDMSLAGGGGLETRVLAFNFGVSVFTGILFGLVPALRASRPQLVPELKEIAGSTGARAGRWSLRNALVVFQFALSLLVLVSAGLCVRSLQKLQRVDGNLEPAKVVLMSFDLGLNHFSRMQTVDFYDRLLDRVRTLPGVESASLARATPQDTHRMVMSFDRAEGYEGAAGERPFADMNMVSAGFFHTFSVPLLAGRDFNADDARGAAITVIVNEAFVRRYWPGQNPVGRRIYNGALGGGPSPETWEVVGVARDFVSQELQSSPRPTVFMARWPSYALTLAVRTGLDPAATIAALRGVVKSLDASVPVFDVHTLAQQRDGSLALQRMAATLLSGFGLLALMLAALGIYGVLAYSVSRRTREIGVRLALGAQVADVLRLVLGEGLGLAGVGLLLGLVGAFGATRLLQGFLFGVQPLDALTFAATTVLLITVALLACWLPARRAAGVNPVEALRAE
jgi:predicted permease